jgi:hypothetical protein
MKDDIKRAVRASQFSRAPGDAPSLGRVARMPGTGLPKKRRRKKKRDSEGKTRTGGSRVRRARRRMILGWSILLALVMLAVFGAAVGFWLIPKMREPKDNLAQLAAEADLKKRVLTRFPSPSEVEAIAIVKAALAVREAAGVSAHFRLGASDAEEVMAFLSELEASAGPVDQFEWLSRMDANGMTVDGVLLSFEGEGRPKNRLALLTPDEAGVWRVDFEALARKCVPRIEEFLAQEIESAQVRVFAVRDNYYNGRFADEQAWKCYSLTSPELETSLFAYAKLGSPQAEAMDMIFSQDEKRQRVTLEIRRVEPRNSRQFEISQVLAEGWVLTERSFDEIFK